ncbi:MAG: hypothetical protein AAF388_19380 [Bacteroidota bacterium]
MISFLSKNSLLMGIFVFSSTYLLIAQDIKSSLSGERDCLIDYSDGMVGISLAHTSFREIEEILGEGVRSKKKYKSFTVENIFPNTEHILSYPSLGIAFTTRTQGRLIFKRIATSLHLYSGSPCTCEDGIGIGSTYDEISQKFGTGYGYDHISSPDGDYSEAAFSSLENNEIFLSFSCKGHKGKDDFRVEKILIHRSFPLSE